MHKACHKEPAKVMIMHETFELFINKLVFSVSVSNKDKVDDAYSPSSQ